MASVNRIALPAGTGVLLPNNAVDYILFTTQASVLTHSQDNSTFVAIGSGVSAGAGNNATEITDALLPYVSCDVAAVLWYRNA